MTESKDVKADGHAHDHDAELKQYFKIFYALLVLTAVTVAAGVLLTGIPDWLGLIIAVAIASVKGTLVVMYFMHLRMERRNILIIAAVPIVLAAILLVALSPDIAGFAAT